MKTATLPLARTGAFALLLLVALPAAADNVNPAVTNGWVTPRPQYCNACSADCPVRPESPDPAASGGNPGSSGCPSCDDESPHAGVGSVSFWQRFGRTPLVAGAPLGRIEIREIGAARLPSGADVLRYNHPLMRRIVDRDDAAGVVAVEEGNGWIVVYRDGVPVGASSGADLEIRRDAATGLFVEQLEDRTRVFYNADNVVDHLVTPDGVRLDWDNAGLDVIWDGSALGQVRSVADGLMDVTRLSPSSFRVSWYPPAAVGDKENGRYVTTASPAKTFTFSYGHVDGEHRLSLLEWRNETFHFNYLWKSRDGLDWTLVRDPDGLALSESVSSTDANGLRTSVRTWSDANGVLRRTSETYRHGANGATLVRTGVIETNGADVATWAASRFETGSAAGRLTSTTNQYGGATIYTYDTHGRLLTGSATVFGSLEEATSYAYETNLVDGFVDRRPRRRTVARGGVVVSDTAYSHGFAPDGGRLDTVTRSDPVSGVSLVSSRLYYPVSSTNAAEAGRLHLALSEDRTATLYSYTPTANGGYVRTSTRGYIAEPDASAPGADASRFAIAPSQSTRTVETVNVRGDVVRVDEFVHTGEGWSAAGWTTYIYNLAHKRTGFADHKGDWESSDWICTGPVWQDLADGTAVTNTFDKAKRLATSTRYTPFGAVTTAYAYNAVGEIVGTTVSTNGVPVRGTLAAYDGRGRRVLSVDEQGRTNTVVYSADNRTVTRTTQAGAITTTTYNADGSVATVSGNVRPYETRTSGVAPATGLSWTEVRTAQSASAPSVLASRTFRNALGQTVREERPAPNGLLRVTRFSHDALGRLVSETTDYVSPDSSIVHSALSIVHSYDALGALVRTVRTAPSGAWRAEDLASRFEARPDGSVWRRTVSVASCSDPSIAALTNRSDRLLFPLSPALRARTVTTDSRGTAFKETERFDRALARTETLVSVPWASNPSRSVALAGLPVEVVDFATVTNRFSHDALGRRVAATDGRGNATSYVYDPFGRVLSTTDPAGFTTSFAYDEAGRRVSATDPLGNAVLTGYDEAGRVISEDGAAWPTRRDYDAYGRRTALRTTRDGFAWDETAWNYDEATGLPLSKTYADGSVVDYGYDAEGRPVRTDWARGAWIGTDLDEWGAPAAVSSSDAAVPDAEFGRDAFGRLVSAAVPGASHRYALDATGRATNEVIDVDGVSVELVRDFDAFGRPVRLRIAGTDYDQSYSYDELGRLSAVGLPGAAVTYAYTPDSLDAGFSILTASNTVLTRALARDPLRPSLILSVSNGVARADAGLPPSERGGAQSAGGSTPCGDPIAIPSFTYAYDALGRPVARNLDAFGYDALGQVVSARFGEGADPDLYDYDFIGNFTSNCLRNAWTQFEANELNEYVSITNHPDHPNHLNLSYDPDGNLLTNGVWSYAYDARNRLTTVWSNDLFVLENRYDFASHRVLKRTPSATHRYYYDGWNPVCEIVVSGDATNRIDYFWGKDLSGTLQGAGGVGGLLAVRTGDSSYYPAYDNNGNIVAYADDSGAVVASYAYDAFGNTKESSGPLSDFFVHRFSTKPLDRETGLYYYGYRFYAPALGRWMNRDPIGVHGGKNVYGFLRNTPIRFYEILGLVSWADQYADDWNDLAAIMGTTWGVPVATDIQGLYPESIPIPPFFPNRKISPWYKYLPDCPCEIPLDCNGIPTNEQNAQGWSDAEETGHKGGTWEIRKWGGILFPPAGQQCVYDSAGKLINIGSAAGTPDWVFPGEKYSLQWFAHALFDALPWWISKELHGEEFAEQLDHERHPPNKGRDCKGNPCPENDGIAHPPPLSRSSAL